MPTMPYYHLVLDTTSEVNKSQTLGQLGV